MNRWTDVGGDHRGWPEMMGLPGWVLTGGPVSVRIKRITSVQFNKAACIITVQFTSWREIESLRTGARIVGEKGGGR